MKAKQDQLYNDVDFLTSIDPPRNYKNRGSLEAVCDYIKSQIIHSGGLPREQKWTVEGDSYSNIIVNYLPEKEEKLIVGAHYDVYGDYPGADDNASAVAGLMECIRLIFQEQPELDYGIEFVAYCLEEPPFFGTEAMGSYIHAKSLFENRTKVLGMICFEMIGYFSDEPNSQPYPTEALAAIYPNTANFIVAVGTEKYRDFNSPVHIKMLDNAEIDVQMISFPDANNSLSALSDHHNYWRFGYPALMINDTSFIRNPNYHEPTDTIDTLDFEKMAAVVSATYQAIKNIK
ncbi:MAG: M28 family peptidase [Crocinitomicaceae bacterium]